MSATDPAGVPQPTNANELQNSLNSVGEYALVQPPSGTTIQAGSSISIPDWVTLDMSGVTLEATHGGAALDIGERSRIYGGTIRLGSGGGIGVRSATNGVRKWGAGPFGTTITAQAGSGAIGHLIRGGRNFFHAPVFGCENVDVPLRMDCRQGSRSNPFITSINATVTATNYVNGIEAVGNDNVRHGYILVDFTPGPNSKNGKVIDNPKSHRICSEGRIRDPGAHDQLIHVKDSDNAGAHAHLSYLGQSSRRNGGLVRDNTGQRPTHVVDFS
jgi:hypothetical protein